MASVFQRERSDVWIASFKAWDAAAKKWVWRQQSTGVTDETVASGIAATLGNAALAAKAGALTREKALRMVNDILRLAGMELVEQAPSLKGMLSIIWKEKDISEGTAKKYRAQEKSLLTWAGAKADLPIDGWTVQMISDYYQHVQKLHSATTANDHLRFVSMVFSRAAAIGHLLNNPVDAVIRVANDSVEKETITRQETARLLRTMRRTRPRPRVWLALASLGWHTGHRIQDLLNVDPKTDVTHHPEFGWLVELRPAKKARQQNARVVVLPIPTWLAKMLRKVGGFDSLRGGDNTNGRISGDFIVWLKAAGIDPVPVQRKNRVVHLKSFHSNRHSMTTRLVSAGVSGELSRLVTDHASAKVQKRYVHAEVAALKEALNATRRRK
jgi:site-specific recombinase XerD